MEQLTYYQLKGKAPVIPITLLGGAVQAGFPSPALDYMEDEISLDETLIKNKHATFFIKVAGDSMKDAGILPGAILIVDRSLTPHDMSIIIAVFDGELLVKHLKKEGNKGWLVPANDKYPHIEIREESEFEVWGVVIHCVNPMGPTSFITIKSGGK